VEEGNHNLSFRKVRSLLRGVRGWAGEANP
jgi:hypothetical protein